ncbi:MAG: hypothetical protein ACLTXS_05940, partial [[Clostridium] symbiosum]
MEHCRLAAMLLALTVSNPVSLVMSKTVRNIMSLLILAFGGMDALLSLLVQYATIVTQHMLCNYC